MHYILLKGSGDQSRVAVNQELKRLRKRVKELEEQIEQMAKNHASEIAFYTGASDNRIAIECLKELKEDVWQASSDLSGLIDNVEVARIIEKRIKELKGESNEQSNSQKN